MTSIPRTLSRRSFLHALSCTGAAAGLGIGWRNVPASPGQLLRKKIPASGESIPVIGMGTWITFNVGDDRALRDQRTQVVDTFFEMGGGMIDSSPMYGSSEEVVGYCLQQLEDTGSLFSATKVWTSWFGGGGSGREQMQQSRELWGLQSFDLMQVHNLVDWQEHLATLRQDKENGKIRYLGVTTSHGRRHDELEAIMRSEPLDFVQLTYNIVDRQAEQRLLPLAAERGIAVIANRPFRQKDLFYSYENYPLPDWAAEIDCANWAQFFLKFVVSHPAITCAIPATTRVDHMRENMGALQGRLPDQAMRREMIAYIESL